MITWTQALKDFQCYLLAANRSAETCRLRLCQIGHLRRCFPERIPLGEGELLAYMASQEWKTETRRSNRAALRVFYAWLERFGHIDHNPARGLPAIRPEVHEARPAPEAVARSAIAEGGRVGLMLSLAAFQGLRRGEIAVVHSNDLSRDLYGYSLRVHGKGRKERVIPLLSEIAAALRRCGDGWAFPSRAGGHLSADYVGRLMSRALPKPWTAHTLRHRFATKAYAGTRDLASVQAMLGHSRPETTLGYIRLPDDALRSVLEAVV